MSKWLTIGIPAYKAEGHISDLLASIQIQTIVDELSIIIAKDNPSDDYEFIKERFPTLDIKILDCEKNTGPGLARQRCADACETEWIIWADADDVFFTPFSLEYLKTGITQDVVEVQGIFYQELIDNPKARTVAKNDPLHPWVFGRIYNTKFLKDMGIKFSELRANEDAEMNWKVRLCIEGTKYKINIIDAPIYLWKTGSEHSITRIGIDDKGIPQYNFDLCAWGATVASINAIKFARKKNPFNGALIRFATEIMIGQYYTYIECLGKKPIFAEQNFFNAKRFYHECYKQIESQIEDEVLENMYTLQRTSKAQDLIGIIPKITFWDFMAKVRTEEYGGEEEFKKIRASLPKEVIENDIESGVATY